MHIRKIQRYHCFERGDLREEEVSHDQEEQRAPSENIIIILFDICKSCWTRLRNSDINNEMTQGAESHDSTSESHG